ncbi:hypothetical protein [Mesorhizobium sp. B2-3-12]|uniref:hypothetical protein n=1 Tax=Mesorhizobium sp. B2-3-12 TaxID=2589952 RepID=UPI001125D9B7|nr:hypothetical protein [Mesorhizobium sp. B2-3-12]TPL85967.1 hypothetical protein FJ948_23190 [Mesorhizobium sp. B2-3-12]
MAASLVATTSAYAADTLQPLAAETVVTRHMSGYSELYLGGLRYPDGDDTLRTAGGAARVNIPFAQRWNLQGDLTYDRTWDDFDDRNGSGGAIHGYYRDPDRFAAGVFATYTAFDFGGDLNPSSYSVGPEVQVYVGNLTLYGQAYVGQLNFGDFHGDEWGVRAVARYFIQKNLRLDGEFLFNRLDEGFNLDVIGGAVQAMYRFDATPWSLFGRYQFERTKGGSFGADKFVIGLRASFGSNSLLDEDRTGATMDTYRANAVININ